MLMLMMLCSSFSDSNTRGLRYANEIRYQISQLPEEEKATYEYIQYLCNPLLVYLSIVD